MLENRMEYTYNLKRSKSLDEAPTFAQKIAYKAATEEKDRKSVAWHKKKAKMAKYKKKQTKSFLKRQYAEDKYMYA